MDEELPSVFEEKRPTAKKEHKCCECGKIIKIGEKYHRVNGCWDGKWHHYNTCIDCNDLRYEFQEDGALPPFGSLWEFAAEAGIDILNRQE